MNLLTCQKPSRYINSELNAIHKQAAISVALAFPDVYEVGMSHLGLKILYDMINALPYASAERAFAPWTDLEAAMRCDGTPLKALESGRPLREFDIVGFSLQYELAYTAVLNMLHLGGIPLRAADRRGRHDLPLVIAGGPCTLNPLPMSVFFDAFLIGDGEDAVPEILAAYHRWKSGGGGDREALLRSLAEIAGVFVPGYEGTAGVTRRVIDSLEAAPYPLQPIVPYAGIVHDRVNIEISRGCSMGCRFCQAGMAYRPVRERSPERILDLAESALRNTGYEDISFTSLSAGDYSCLPQLLKEFNRRFASRRISISLPSLRVGSVNSEVLREIRFVRKTGFTIAPEAATDRLRGVINKDFSEEMYLKALETLFAEGWQNLKMYFMSGLPTETEEDIAAIPEMVFRAIKISRRLTGRHVNISVGVSSFIPKPHTPFQWCGQEDIAVLREKNSFLRKSFLKRGVKYKGHKEEMSLLEAAFARGDARLADLIEKAWSLGCRLDAWTEEFDFSKWEEAMQQTGIDAAAYARRNYTLDEPLPWDVVRTGVSTEFLKKEYGRALEGGITVDCRQRCHVCGLVCAKGPEKTELPAAQADDRHLQRSGTAGRPNTLDMMRVRLEYAKTGRLRYLSHLELTTAIVRGLRRADFPLRYSSGFHPAPRVSFGPALRVGVAGMKEYLDIELDAPFDPAAGLARLNTVLPEGLRGLRLVAVYGKERSLTSFVTRYAYEVRNADPAAVTRFMEQREVSVERKGTPVNLRAMVDEASATADGICICAVKDLGETKVRLEELCPALFGRPFEELEITRTGLFGWESGWVEPLAGERAWAARS